jgi:Glyoxalase superfamily protein
MRDFRDAKTMAHSLRDALKRRTVETTYSECRELIATVFGYDNWNVLSAKIEAAARAR